MISYLAKIPKNENVVIFTNPHIFEGEVISFDVSFGVLTLKSGYKHFTINLDSIIAIRKMKGD